MGNNELVNYVLSQCRQGDRIDVSFDPMAELDRDRMTAVLFVALADNKSEAEQLRPVSGYYIGRDKKTFSLAPVWDGKKNDVHFFSGAIKIYNDAVDSVRKI